MHKVLMMLYIAALMFVIGNVAYYYSHISTQARYPLPPEITCNQGQFRMTSGHSNGRRVEKLGFDSCWYIGK